MTTYREAEPAEISSWDDLTVRPAGGHVLQSRAWAAYRERAGWTPRFLIGDDGSAILVLLRPWPVIGGWSAYLSRGPIPTAGAPIAVLAGRLDGAARWLAEHGVDVVAADPQVRADTGYGAAVETIGFHEIEEIQPSRHRLSVPLGPGVGEDEALARVTKQTRQRIRKAESDGLAVVRYDRGPGANEVGHGFVAASRPIGAALGEFYDLLIATAERRHFDVLSRARFLDWTTAAHDAGQLLYLEARGDEAAPVAGLVVYRHGERLSTFLSGDRNDARERHPGAFHLLRWRTIQLAIREGRAEMDLDGADVPGARRVPEPGEPAYGLYQHKRSFGAEWVELVGARERVVRPGRYAAGRLLAGVARRAGGAG
ncbi:MAG TPA: GNAT family N-acetyltransferase [Candidatus Limnocylindrales bacterium]|nr:GNAT family N-acetyltransferase [Candidatus Limnocylindrales bacterium]